MNIIERAKGFYWNHVANPYEYAKHIGVNIGENCLIATKGFSTEPYLITIGNHVQLTVGCQIHTHGGAILYEIDTQSLTFLEKSS